MKLKYLFLALLCSISFSNADTITAEELLSDVVARLPRDPLEISGKVIVRKRRGVVVREFGFEMLLKWGATPSVASYILSDTAGKELGRLVVTRRPGSAPVYQYLEGDQLKEPVEPDLFAPIYDSDMSWMDITLSFLWWPGGKLCGEEEIRGRDCYVVEMPSPRSGEDAYSRVRVWIDKEMRMLLQAEGFDRDGDIQRKLWIRSFKKIDERWMVKDMEVQSYPSVHRTKLRIDEVKLQE